MDMLWMNMHTLLNPASPLSPLCPANEYRKEEDEPTKPVQKKETLRHSSQDHNRLKDEHDSKQECRE